MWGTHRCEFNQAMSALTQLLSFFFEMWMYIIQFSRWLIIVVQPPELVAPQHVGIYLLLKFFPRSGFWFFLAVSQCFHWYLISRDNSCILTQCYVIVQCSCVKKWLFELPAVTHRPMNLNSCLPSHCQCGQINRYRLNSLLSNQSLLANWLISSLNLTFKPS